MFAAWKKGLLGCYNFTNIVVTNPFNHETLNENISISNKSKSVLPVREADDFTSLSLMNQATRIIGNARNIVIITGAGISADSGIPTYRSLKSESQGIWDKAGYFKMAYYGSWIGWILSNNSAWQLYYEHYYKYALNAKPNEGHKALTELYKLKKKHCDLTIITQNVDGLHHKAGVPKDDIIEMHGNASRFKCNICGSKKLNNLIIPMDINQDFKSPKCPTCQIGKGRPDVVFFGERLKIKNVMNALSLLKSLDSDDCVIVIGTSLSVKPVAELPQIALENGVPIIEVNLEECIPGDNKDNIFLKGKASIVLPQIIKLLCALVLQKDAS